MAGTEIAAIIIAAITIIGGVLTAAIKLGGDYLLKRLELRQLETKQQALKEGIQNLEKEITAASHVETICRDIKEYVKANKCNVWMFHNGGYFYNGSDQQKMSMVINVADDGTDIRQNFSNISVGVFSRNLIDLINSDTNYTHQRNELAFKDTLGVINTQFDVTSSAIFKLMSQDNKDWVGILAMAWDFHNELTDKEINFIQTKLPEISRLLSRKLLK